MTGVETVDLEQLQAVAVGLAGDGAKVQGWKQGIDFCVYKVSSPDSADFVLRVPVLEQVSSPYEEVTDYADIIERECFAYPLLERHGVPVPKLLGADFSRSKVSFSWMALELVDSDDPVIITEAVERELGSVASRIHAIRIDDTPLAVAPHVWKRFATERINKRLNAAREYVELPNATECEAFVNETVARSQVFNRMLHLDLRAPNLCVRDERIVGVIDLSNCLGGDPWFELARLNVCELLTPSFLEGYEFTVEDIDAHQKLLDAYSIDTLTLQAMISRRYLNDEVLFETAIAKLLATFDRYL